MKPLDMLGASILGGRIFFSGASIEPILEVTTSVDGDLIITASGSQITLTLTEPAAYAETYVVEMENFSAGPILLRAPEVVGDGAVGETLSVTPGLWLFESHLPRPTLTTTWQRNGTDIPGATDLTYVAVSEDAGTDLTVSETALGENGTSHAMSQPLSVPALEVDPIAVLFASNEVGFVLLPGTSYGYCYQETTGENATTPCGDGDFVGTYFDAVSGRYATAPSDAQRPVYRDTGTSVFLDFSLSGDRRLAVPLDLTSTDRMVGVIGANKQGGSSFGVVCEFTESSKDNNGSFSINQAGSGANGWNVRARGTAGQTAGITSGFAPGSNDVVTCLADLTADSLILRANGEQVASSSDYLGGGTFADDILYIGGRSDGLVNPFSGALFGLVLRGAAMDAPQVLDLEAYVAARTGGL